MKLGSLLRVLGVGVALSLGFAACGSSGNDQTTGDTGSNTVAVELGENGSKYFINLDKTTVSAGETTFVIDNVGTMHHEFVIFKTDLPADQLPLNDEGEVDEEELELIGEAVYARPVRGDEDHRIREGRGVDYTVTLQPGKYVLLCNLPGHYKAGQYVEFTVEGDEVPEPAPAGEAPKDGSDEIVGTAVNVQLGEKGAKYFIKADTTSVAAGDTTFVIDNVGTMHHELVIFKTDLAPDKLPLNDEGKVDEDQLELIGEAKYVQPIRGDEDHRIREGRGVNYTVNLEPGKYVFVCNLAGHYKAGQYMAFTVN